MRRTFPTIPKEVHLVGLAGLGKIRFLAVIAHGKGTREVSVDVPPELILRLADALRATAPWNGVCPCDTKSSKYDAYDEFSVSHAVWHVEHPNAPMPCIDRSKTIDVGTALPMPSPFADSPAVILQDKYGPMYQARRRAAGFDGRR